MELQLSDYHKFRDNLFNQLSDDNIINGEHNWIYNFFDDRLYDWLESMGVKIVEDKPKNQIHPVMRECLNSFLKGGK